MTLEMGSSTKIRKEHRPNYAELEMNIICRVAIGAHNDCKDRVVRETDPGIIKPDYKIRDWLGRKIKRIYTSSENRATKIREISDCIVLPGIGFI